MGYYTTFYFHRIEGPKEDFENMLKDVDKKLGTTCAGEPDGVVAKWYDYDKDIIELSEKYPDLVFAVEGYGENSDDAWKEWWHNGKTYREKLEFSSYEMIKKEMV